jgi:sugar/nucleoside kinase (ribokinase family)
MARGRSAVVAGHICLDIFPGLAAYTRAQFERMFLPGRLLVLEPVTLSTGGAVSNTGLSLHRLGIPTRLMGKVGDDLFGQAVRQIVDTHGPRLSDALVVDKRESTSYTVIINVPDRDRTFLHCPGANDTFGPDDVRYDVVAQAGLFHFGYPPVMRRMFEDGGAGLVEMFRRVKRLGVTTSLDMTLPDPNSPAGRPNWAAILEAVMPYVDIFLPSFEESLDMLHRESYDEVARTEGGGGVLRSVAPSMLSELGAELVAMGGKIVGLKLGDRGLYLRTASESAINALGAARPSRPAAWADRELWISCFKVDVVGTTGAGDATIAGFLSALLRDMPPEEALTMAVAVGACNVEAADALSGVLSWEDTLQRVQSGWAQRELVLDAPGWRLDARKRMWLGPSWRSGSSPALERDKG